MYQGWFAKLVKLQQLCHMWVSDLQYTNFVSMRKSHYACVYMTA